MKTIIKNKNKDKQKSSRGPNSSENRPRFSNKCAQRHDLAPALVPTLHLPFSSKPRKSRDTHADSPSGLCAGFTCAWNSPPAPFGHLLFVLGFVLRHHLLQEAASHPGPLRPQEAVLQWDPAGAQSAGSDSLPDGRGCVLPQVVSLEPSTVQGPLERSLVQ